MKTPVLLRACVELQLLRRPETLFWIPLAPRRFWKTLPAPLVAEFGLSCTARSKNLYVEAAESLQRETQNHPKA